MLNTVKLALRIATSSFDTEIQLLIDDCLLELEGLGITNISADDSQIISTVIAYCKWKFGNNEDKEQWASIYHEKVAQLQMMSGYTDWRE